MKEETFIEKTRTFKEESDENFRICVQRRRTTDGRVSILLRINDSHVYRFNRKYSYEQDALLVADLLEKASNDPCLIKDEDLES